MIETPRAAIRADEIAEESDFFSFGTNDLTQMTFGFSRDDVESRMMPAYLEQGLLKRNPFETIDQTGVGELVRMGAERGRADQARAQARRVRRARRRPRVDRPVLRRRPRLRQLLAVPGADRPPGRRPGDRRRRRRHQVGDVSRRRPNASANRVHSRIGSSAPCGVSTWTHTWSAPAAWWSATRRTTASMSPHTTIASTRRCRRSGEVGLVEAVPQQVVRVVRQPEVARHVFDRELDGRGRGRRRSRPSARAPAACPGRGSGARAAVCSTGEKYGWAPSAALAASRSIFGPRAAITVVGWSGPATAVNGASAIAAR